MRRRQLATAAVAALVVGGCGSRSSNPADFSLDATRACSEARQAADALPEQASDLVQYAALRVKELRKPPSAQAAAAALVAGMERQGRSTEQLAKELKASAPDVGRITRLQAAVDHQRRSIDALASPVGVRGCGTIPRALLRGMHTGADTAAAAESSRMSPAAYRRDLRAVVEPLARRTQAIQAAAANGTFRIAALDGYADGVGRAADRLARLRAPADVADVNAALVRGLRSLRAAAAAAARELRAGRATQAVAVIQRFSASRTFKRFGETLATLRDEGYLR